MLLKVQYHTRFRDDRLWHSSKSKAEVAVLVLIVGQIYELRHQMDSE
jgi:hypothetical protein